MQEAKHTPGPWHIFRGNECFQIARDRSATEVIAKVEDHAPTDGDMEAEAKANARLIAAAPELLEALKELKRCMLKSEPYQIPEYMDAVKNARAAIAKATSGEAA